MTSVRRDLARRSKLLERVLLDLLVDLLQEDLQHLKLRQGWDQVHTGLRLVDLLQEVLEVLAIGLELQGLCGPPILLPHHAVLLLLVVPHLLVVRLKHLVQVVTALARHGIRQGLGQARLARSDLATALLRALLQELRRREHRAQGLHLHHIFPHESRGTHYRELLIHREPRALLRVSREAVALGRRSGTGHAGRAGALRGQVESCEKDDRGALLSHA